MKNVKVTSKTGEELNEGLRFLVLGKLVSGTWDLVWAGDDKKASELVYAQYAQGVRYTEVRLLSTSLLEIHWL